MSYHKLPAGLLEFVRENAAGKSSAELANLCNTAFGTDYTAKSMKAYKSYHGIRSGIQPKPPTVFTEEIRSFIFKNHDGLRYAEMAQLVNSVFGTDIGEDKMRWFYQNNKLRANTTVNPNEKAPGSISPDKDGYLRVKLADGRWRLLHHVVWENHNGPIPNGHMVIFLDGDISNTDIKNLALVTRAESLILSKNNLRFSHPQHTETGILIAKVSIAANQRKKGRQKK